MLSRADSNTTVSMTETRKNGAHEGKNKWCYLPRELRYVRTNDSDLEKVSSDHSTKET